MFGRFLTSCPSCKKRFGVKISKVILVKNDKEHESQLVNLPGGAARPGVPPTFMQTKREISMTRKFYEVIYRCSTCGNSWTENKVKALRD